MKRLISILIAVGLSVISYAQTISYEQALEKAMHFFKIPATKASVDELYPVYGLPTKASGDSDIYIFNRRGGGFVIINGRASGTPILGYSLNNHFSVEGMPESLKPWFDCLKNTGRQSSGTKSRDFAVDEVSEIVNLHTAEWSQDEPFNNKCPEVDGFRAPTGCVQTATAILMQYYGWPRQGKGRTEDYYDSWSEVNREGYELTTVYKWDELKKINTVSDALNASPEIQDNLAQLHRDLGAIMKAQYGSAETGANNAEQQIAKYMGYKAAASERLDCKSYEDWLIYLKGFLDKKQPVFTIGGAHQYIVDGYDSNDYFHFNYGWGGINNGFYFIDGYSYMTFGMAATGNIVPDYDGENEPVNGYIYLAAADHPSLPWGFWINPFHSNDIIWGGGSQEVWRGSNEEVVPGIKYEASIKLMNTSGIPYEGDIKLVLEDKNGNMKLDNVQNNQINLAGEAKNPFHISIESMWGKDACGYFMVNPDCPLEFGDKLAVYHTRSEGVWEKVPSYNDDGTVSERPVFPCFIIKTSEHYSVGDTFECRLVNGCRPYGASFAWEIDSVRAYSIWEILDESGTVVYTYRNDVRENRFLGPYYKFTSPGNYTVNVSVYDAFNGGKQTDFISTFISVE